MKNVPSRLEVPVPKDTRSVFDLVEHMDRNLRDEDNIR